MRSIALRLVAVVGAFTAEAFASPRVAAADERIEVHVTPSGAPWTIGDEGGRDCDPTCTIYVSPGTYELRFGDLKQEMPLLTPSEVTYHTGTPKLRTAAGWTAVGGVGLGAAIMGFGIYGFITSCTPNSQCLDDTGPVSRTSAEVLIFGAAGLITISAAGGIVFALTSPSLNVSDLSPADARPRARPFDLVLSPSARGGTALFKASF